MMLTMDGKLKKNLCSQLLCVTPQNLYTTEDHIKTHQDGIRIPPFNVTGITFLKRQKEILTLIKAKPVTNIHYTPGQRRSIILAILASIYNNITFSHSCQSCSSLSLYYPLKDPRASDWHRSQG